MRPRTVIAIPFMFALAVGCNSSSFSGESSTGSNTDAADSSPTPEPAAPIECEIKGDQVQINQHAATIMECINSGMIYHFGWKKCTDVPKATSFECTFVGAKEAVEKIGMQGKLLDEAAAENAKLIGCGEKNDGNTIIVQWWITDGEDCNFDASSTKTVCFKHYDSGEKPPDPTTDEEVTERVRQCIEE